MSTQEQCALCRRTATHKVWDKDEVPQAICDDDKCQQKILAMSEASKY